MPRLRLVWNRSAMKEPPKTLDAIADVVLAYRPKPVSKPAKKRKRRIAKIEKEKVQP
jgi:hypothetical protein